METTETTTEFLDQLERQADQIWVQETYAPEPVFISFKGYDLSNLDLGKYFYIDSNTGSGEGTWEELKEGIETLLLTSGMTDAMITIPPGSIEVMDDLEDMARRTSRTVTLLPQSPYGNGEAIYVVEDCSN